jgi:glycosyltransferase involved in cell wall biosynthesis
MDIGESRGLRVLIVSVEPPWPPLHGGRIRTARLAEALSSSGAQVTVLAPADEDLVLEGPPGIEVVALPRPNNAMLRRCTALASPWPKLGLVHLGQARTQIAAFATEADVVVWSHDYLAAACRLLPGPRSVVDLPNIEYERQRSMAREVRLHLRLPKMVEALKARRWEPRVWRAADAVLTLTASDHRRVLGVHAPAVYAPNGVASIPYRPSPDNGTVLMVGSFRYQPNRTGAEWLIREVWPVVHGAEPSARLVIAGREARVVGPAANPSGIEIVSDFEEAESLYREAAVVAVPVSSGGGAQLKMSEALAHQRLIVSRTHGRNSLPKPVIHSGQIQWTDSPARFAEHLLSALRDPSARRRAESSASATGALDTWEDSLKRAVDVVLGR